MIGGENPGEILKGKKRGRRAPKSSSREDGQAGQKEGKGIEGEGNRRNYLRVGKGFALTQGDPDGFRPERGWGF